MILAGLLLSVVSVLSLAATTGTALGWIGEDPHRHFALALFAGPVSLFTLTMHMFYFIGTGRAVKNALAAPGVDPGLRETLVAEVADFKRRSFPSLFWGMMALVAVFVSAGIALHFGRGGTVHAAIGLFATALTAYALAKAHLLLRRNFFLMMRVAEMQRAMGIAERECGSDDPSVRRDGETRNPPVGVNPGGRGLDGDDGLLPGPDQIMQQAVGCGNLAREVDRLPREERGRVMGWFANRQEKRIQNTLLDCASALYYGVFSRNQGAFRRAFRETVSGSRDLDERRAQIADVSLNAAILYVASVNQGVRDEIANFLANSLLQLVGARVGDDGINRPDHRRLLLLMQDALGAGAVSASGGSIKLYEALGEYIFEEDFKADPVGLLLFQAHLVDVLSALSEFCRGLAKREW